MVMSLDPSTICIYKGAYHPVSHIKELKKYVWGSRVQKEVKGVFVLSFLFCHKAEILMRDNCKTEGKFCALCMGLFVIEGPNPRAENEVPFV